MINTNKDLDFSNLINLLQNMANPVEDRESKTKQFKTFLSQVIRETLESDAIKNIGKYSFEIYEANITEDFKSIVDRDNASGRIESTDKVYLSFLNGEKLLLFTDKWFDNLGLVWHDEQYDLAYLHDLKYFAEVLGTSFEKAFIKISSRQNQGSNKIILSNEKSTCFIGLNSEYLKTEERNQNGYFAKFKIHPKANGSEENFQIWISSKIMEQINLETLNTVKQNIKNSKHPWDSDLHVFIDS